MVAEEGEVGCPVSLSCSRAPLRLGGKKERAEEDDSSPGVNAAITAVYEALEEELFQWEEVSLVLPESAFAPTRPTASYIAPAEGHMTPRDAYPEQRATQKRTALFPELFSHARAHNECTELGGGRLSPEQLESIWRTGCFDVDSKRFPGKTHRWRVNPMIAEGVDNLKDHFAQRCAGAAEHVIYGIPDRLMSPYGMCEREHLRETLSSKCSLTVLGPSVLHALKRIGKAAKSTADALIGFPSYRHPGSLCQALTEAKVRFAVLEFYDAIAEEAVEYAELQRTIEESFGHVEDDFFLSEERGVYVVNEGSSEHAPGKIDLRLWFGVRSFAEECRLVAQPLINEIHSDFLTRRREIIDDLVTNGEAVGLSEREAITKLRASCQTLLIEEIRDRLSSLEIFSSESGKALLDRIMASLRVNTTKATVDKEVEEERETMVREVRQRIKAEHAVLGKISRWLSSKAETEMRRMLDIPQEISLNRHWELTKDRRCIDQLESLSDPCLDQEIYLLKRCLEWEEEHSLAAAAEIAEQESMPTFTSTLKRWWWSGKMTSSGCPREGTRIPCSSTFYGWRLHHAGARTIDLTTRIAIASLNVMLWGRFSMRALFLREEFKHPKAPKHQPTTLTYWCRLKGAIALYNNSVARFESEPDTGMLGKGVSRIFHRVFTGLYLCASLALVGLLMPPLCVVMTPASGAVAALSPVIASGISVSSYGFWLIRSLITTTVKIAAMSPLEIIISLLAATVFHPACAAILQPMAVGMASFGYTYYSLCQKVIAHSGKVPRTDSFAARRVSGPGISYNTYKKCSLPAALAVVRVRLEELELSLLNERAITVARRPLALFRRLVSQITKPFVSSTSPFNGYLENESETISRMIGATCQKRMLELPQVVHTSEPVRLEAEDLDTLLTLASTLVKDFLEQRVFSGIFGGSLHSQREFWNSHDLREGSFGEMAKALLVDGLGPDVLHPLTEDDCSVEISTGEVPGMERFISMAVEAKKPLEPLAESAVSIRRSMETQGSVVGGFATVPMDCISMGLAPPRLVSVKLPRRERQDKLRPRSQAEYDSLLTVSN